MLKKGPFIRMSEKEQIQKIHYLSETSFRSYLHFMKDSTAEQYSIPTSLLSYSLRKYVPSRGVRVYGQSRNGIEQFWQCNGRRRRLVRFGTIQKDKSVRNRNFAIIL